MDTHDYNVGELMMILDIARRMTEQYAVAPLLEYIATAAIELVGAERCYIVFFDPDGQPEFRVARDEMGREIAEANEQVSSSVIAQVQRTLTPLLVSDAIADTRFAHATSVRSLGLRSIICVPLISFGAAVGALYLENRSLRNRFGEAHLPVVLLFANQATVAIEHAARLEDLERRIDERTETLLATNQKLEQQAAELRQRMAELELLRDQLREQSLRDELTGLYNRRFLMDTLARYFSQATRYEQPLTLALIDIDDFKRINDSSSHQVGDQALCELARILTQNLRKADLVARYGGEEFALILPVTGPERAMRLCERLRKAIAGYNWGQLVPGLTVTASIGIASAAEVTSDAELLRLADKRLYEAKGAGKNRVVWQAP